MSLFSGIGAPEKALTNLGVHYDLVAYSEIDKFASKSYSLIHNVSEDLNLGDIQSVDGSEFEDIDLITYGFPCTSISHAGRREGFYDESGNKAQSGLFFDALRVIQNSRPRVAIAENVKALTFKRCTDEFSAVLSSLEEAGYNNYWKVLNTTDFNIPQNRERVFVVSIRKDIDDGKFTFPIGEGLHYRLKDFLEDNVGEKYYLSEKMIKYIASNGEKWTGNNNKSLINKSIASTINTREGSRRCDASNFIAPDLEGEDIDLKPIIAKRKEFKN